MRGLERAAILALAMAAGCATTEPGRPPRPSRTLARLPEPAPERTETVPEDAAGDPRPQRQMGFGFVWGGVTDASGTLFEGEAEFRVAKPLGLAAALAHYGYEWGNGERLAPGVRAEEEEGEGYGFGAELRWYTSGRAFGGFYIGAGVSAFPFSRWTARQDDDLSGVYEEDEIRKGRDPVYDVHAALGFTWRPHKGFALTPNVIFGNFFSRSPDSGLYAGVGLRGSLGF